MKRENLDKQLLIRANTMTDKEIKVGGLHLWHIWLIIKRHDRGAKQYKDESRKVCYSHNSWIVMDRQINGYTDKEGDYQPGRGWGFVSADGGEFVHDPLLQVRIDAAIKESGANDWLEAYNAILDYGSTPEDWLETYKEKILERQKLETKEAANETAKKKAEEAARKKKADEEAKKKAEEAARIASANSTENTEPGDENGNGRIEPQERIKMINASESIEEIQELMKPSRSSAVKQAGEARIEELQNASQEGE